MEVVPSDDVTPAGEHLRVPPPSESVGNTDVRAAVKEEVERVFLRAVEARRISDPHLDLLAVRTQVSTLSCFASSTPESNESLKVESLEAAPVARSSRTRVGGSEKLSRSATATRPFFEIETAAKLCSLVSGVTFPDAASMR